MPGYATRELLFNYEDHEYKIRALSDKQQFSDADGAAERAGISSAQWSLFGQIWPSGEALALLMSTFDIQGKRILELGCGLGLASIVLRYRDADVTASDYHPLAGKFLAHNTDLNNVRAIPYRDLSWAIPDETLGRFDLIIGSDILYERGHAALLTGLMFRHTNPTAQILITDPGRGHSGALTRALAKQGFVLHESLGRGRNAPPPAFRSRLLNFERTHIPS
jgi:predicted nicotinamide N-methyase